MVLVVLTIGMEMWLYRSRGVSRSRGAGFQFRGLSRVGWPVGSFRGRALVCALGAVVAGVCLASRWALDRTRGCQLGVAVFCSGVSWGAVLTGGRGSFVGALVGAVFLLLFDNVIRF